MGGVAVQFFNQRGTFVRLDEVVLIITLDCLM